MAWLSQNWIWILAAIAVFYFMTRMHGMGHGRGHSFGHDSGRGDRQPDQGTVIDPVSRHVVAMGSSAFSAAYRGRAYYFENREDRDAFEAAPEKYIGGLPAAGQSIGSEDGGREAPRRRRGC